MIAVDAHMLTQRRSIVMMSPKPGALCDAPIDRAVFMITGGHTLDARLVIKVDGERVKPRRIDGTTVCVVEVDVPESDRTIRVFEAGLGKDTMSMWHVYMRTSSPPPLSLPPAPGEWIDRRRLGHDAYVSRVAGAVIMRTAGGARFFCVGRLPDPDEIVVWSGRAGDHALALHGDLLTWAHDDMRASVLARGRGLGISHGVVYLSLPGNRSAHRSVHDPLMPHESDMSGFATVQWPAPGVGVFSGRIGAWWSSGELYTTTEFDPWKGVERVVRWTPDLFDVERFERVEIADSRVLVINEALELDLYTLERG